MGGVSGNLPTPGDHCEATSTAGCSRELNNARAHCDAASVGFNRDILPVRLTLAAKALSRRQEADIAVAASQVQ